MALVGSPDRVISINDLEGIEHSLSTLVLELPQREIGGQLPSWDELTRQAEWARARGTRLHLDGARLWEAQAGLGRPLREICALFDSVYVSFYKGIGGIAGAMLLGPREFIAKARVWQRRQGGNLISLYPYVLSSRRGLRERLSRFPEYRARALAVANTLDSIPGISINPSPPHTTMMHVYLNVDGDNANAELESIARSEGVSLVPHLGATAIQDRYKFELSVGDATMAITDVEIHRWFSQVMAAAKP